MKLSVAASCLLSLPIPTAMASTAKATKANTSPHMANTSPNKIIHSEYFLGPASCPKHCVSGANFGGILAADNVQQCNPEDKNQRWIIHQVSDGGGEVIKAESPENAGRCLGVAAHNGGDDMLGVFDPSLPDNPIVYASPGGTFASVPHLAAPSANEDTCNGQLALVDCQDPTANWLFTGAELYSAECWINGHSAAMTVNEDCTSLELSLAANGAPEPMTRAQSFMLLEPSFVESITDVPSADEGGPKGSSYNTDCTFKQCTDEGGKSETLFAEGEYEGTSGYYCVCNFILVGSTKPSTACEQWAMYRGECARGRGDKIIFGTYCANAGGELSNVESKFLYSSGDPIGNYEVCTVNGAQCAEYDYYGSSGCADFPTTSDSGDLGYLKIFVTSGSYKGDLGGVSGADRKCQDLANDAGLDGVFRAWISQSNSSPAQSWDMPISDRPYYLVDGTMVADGWNHLFNALSNELYHPINKNEYGQTVTDPPLRVWTSTNWDGNQASTDNCMGWSKSGPYWTGKIQIHWTGRYGWIEDTNHNWSWKGEMRCHWSGRLYCVQQNTSA